MPDLTEQAAVNFSMSLPHYPSVGCEMHIVILNLRPHFMRGQYWTSIKMHLWQSIKKHNYAYFLGSSSCLILCIVSGFSKDHLQRQKDLSTLFRPWESSSLHRTALLRPIANDTLLRFGINVLAKLRLSDVLFLSKNYEFHYAMTCISDSASKSSS